MSENFTTFARKIACVAETDTTMDNIKNVLNVPSNVPGNVPGNVPSSVPSNVPSFTPNISRVSLHLSLACPVMKESDLKKAVKVIVALHDGDMSMQVIISLVGDNNRSRVRKNIVAPLIKEGLIAYTLAENPNSPTQTYRLTELSQSLLKTPDYITDPQSLNIQ